MAGMEFRLTASNLARLSRNSAFRSKSIYSLRPLPRSHVPPASCRYFSLFPSSKTIPSDPIPPPAPASTPPAPAPQNTDVTPLDAAQNILDSIKDLPAETKVSLADFGLGDTWYVGSFQKIFVMAHEITGLPWWLSISATVFALRIVLLPAVAYFMAHNVRMANVQPQMKPLMERLKVANQRKDIITLQQVQKEAQDLLKSNNVSPLRMLGLPLLQGPIFIGIFLALKRMAEAGWPEFVNGGAFWFPDLTQADPYYILPATSTLATLVVLRIGADTGIAMTEQQKTMFKFFGAALLGSFYFIMQFPTGVLVYWVTQNLLSLCQAFAMKRPAVKRFLNIPERRATTPEPANQAAPMSFWEGVQAGAAMKEASKEPSQIANKSAKHRTAKKGGQTQKR